MQSGTGRLYSNADACRQVAPLSCLEHHQYQQLADAHNTCEHSFQGAILA